MTKKYKPEEVQALKESAADNCAIYHNICLDCVRKYMKTPYSKLNSETQAFIVATTNMQGHISNTTEDTPEYAKRTAVLLMASVRSAAELIKSFGYRKDGKISRQEESLIGASHILTSQLILIKQIDGEE